MLLSRNWSVTLHKYCSTGTLFFSHSLCAPVQTAIATFLARNYAQLFPVMCCLCDSVFCVDMLCSIVLHLVLRFVKNTVLATLATVAGCLFPNFTNQLVHRDRNKFMFITD